MEAVGRLRRLVDTAGGLWLASSSPRRIELLRQIGLDPVVRKPSFAEDLDWREYKDPVGVGDMTRWWAEEWFETGSTP